MSRLDALVLGERTFPFHSFDEMGPQIQTALGDGVAADRTENRDALLDLSGYDLVVDYLTDSTLSDDQQAGLLGFVEDGGGYLGVHCAADLTSTHDGDGGIARTGSHSNTANPWVLLRRGEVTTERVWAAYEANLRYVLEEVAALLDNVSGRLVLTADHGNCFGEWGLYGHPMHTPVPALLAVPWAETTAVDSGTRSPSIEPPEDLPVSRVYGADSDRDRLDALGYL